MNKILIIDDEAQIRKLLARIMELEGYEVLLAGDCKSALKQIQTHAPEVILCDVYLPDGNGVNLVLDIKKKYPDLEAILLTAHGNIPDCVQAIKNGAFDYITKGNENNKIIPVVERAFNKIRTKYLTTKQEAQKSPSYSFNSIIGNSKPINEALSLALKVSVTDVPVLLTGETGTGKEVFAQAIHHNSPRNKSNFVAVNCSSFSKELLESEMFGHKAGSFTGALKDKKGLFEEANNGTIFLDEIGEMAFELQAKLLRILECGEYIKIGDTKPTKVNVRIIAATNRDLKREIDNNHFREDLYYRLSVFQIHLPPLRSRTEDIGNFAQFFVQTYSNQLNNSLADIDSKVIEVFKEYPWKGNIRELRNVIERSLIVCSNNHIELEDLPLEMQKGSLAYNDGKELSDFDMSLMERRHISKVLEYTKGNKAEAARLLKIGIATLYRKIEEYKI
jgi:two-component system NtrC family response regulator